MATDVVTLITRDHRELEKLFGQLRSGDNSVLPRVKALLVAHSRAEEEHVYPRIEKLAPEEKGEVRHGAREHHEAEDLLHRVEALKPGSAEFVRVRDQFIDAVLHHAKEEESEILPALQEVAGEPELEALGVAFTRRRQQELDRASSAPGQRRSGTPDLGEATRDELYAQAREQRIEGRSKMNKEQLADALRNRKS